MTRFRQRLCFHLAAAELGTPGLSPALGLAPCLGPLPTGRTLGGAAGELARPPASSEMASASNNRGVQAVSRRAPEHDGAICEPARPGVVDNEVMSTIGAHQAADMPGLLRQGTQGKAGGTPSPAPSPSSARPFLDGPLSPRTASSFDPADASPQLPFFINNSSSTTSLRDSSSYLFPIHDTCRSPNPTTAPVADCLPLLSTFYLSPSASRSSRAFSLSSSDISGNSCQTQRIMPGQTYDALPEHRFPSPVPNDYFSLAYAPTDLRTDDTTQLRPRSAGSRGTERTGSPLSFARWARRHHHHGDYHHGEEEGYTLKGRDRGSAERKAANRSSPKRLGRPRSRSLQKRQPQAAVPQMTREEFEALPLAIQRKVRQNRLLARFRHPPEEHGRDEIAALVGVSGPKSVLVGLAANKNEFAPLPPRLPLASARACSRFHARTTHNQ